MHIKKKKKIGWGINHLPVNNSYFWEVESLVISSFFLLLVQILQIPFNEHICFYNKKIIKMTNNYIFI